MAYLIHAGANGTLFLTCSGQNWSCHISKNSPCAHSLIFFAQCPLLRCCQRIFSCNTVAVATQISFRCTSICTIQYSESTSKFRCFSTARTFHTKLSYSAFHPYGFSDEFQAHVLSQHFQVLFSCQVCSYQYHMVFMHMVFQINFRDM